MNDFTESIPFSDFIETGDVFNLVGVRIDEVRSSVELVFQLRRSSIYMQPGEFKIHWVFKSIPFLIGPNMVVY